MSSGTFSSAAGGTSHKMDGRTNFAHGHFSESYLTRPLHASGVSLDFYHDLPTFAFARPKNNRLPSSRRGAGTATMRVASEIELSTAESSPPKAPGRQRYHRQRNRLLPIPA